MAGFLKSLSINTHHEENDPDPDSLFTSPFISHDENMKNLNTIKNSYIEKYFPKSVFNLPEPQIKTDFETEIKNIIHKLENTKQILNKSPKGIIDYIKEKKEEETKEKEEKTKEEEIKEENYQQFKEKEGSKRRYSNYHYTKTKISFKTITETYDIGNSIVKKVICDDKLIQLLHVIIETTFMKLAYNFFHNSKDLTMSVPNVDISFRKIQSKDDYKSKDDYNYVVYLEIEKVNESEYQLFSKIKHDKIYSYFKDNNTSAEEVYKSIYDNLDALNKYGIYHNDLNPWNLFIRVENQKPYFKIIDFGNASFRNYYMRNSLKKYESLDSKNKSQGEIIPGDFSSWIEGYTNVSTDVDFSEANIRNDGKQFPTFGGSNHRTRKRKQKKKASRKKRSKKNRRSQKKNRKHRRQ